MVIEERIEVKVVEENENVSLKKSREEFETIAKEFQERFSKSTFLNTDETGNVTIESTNPEYFDVLKKLGNELKENENKEDSKTNEDNKVDTLKEEYLRKKLEYQKLKAENGGKDLYVNKQEDIHDSCRFRIDIWNKDTAQLKIDVDKLKKMYPTFTPDGLITNILKEGVKSMLDPRYKKYRPDQFDPLDDNSISAWATKVSRQLSYQTQILKSIELSQADQYTANSTNKYMIQALFNLRYEELKENPKTLTKAVEFEGGMQSYNPDSVVLIEELNDVTYPKVVRERKNKLLKKAGLISDEEEDYS